MRYNAPAFRVEMLWMLNALLKPHHWHFQQVQERHFALWKVTDTTEGLAAIIDPQPVLTLRCTGDWEHIVDFLDRQLIFIVQRDYGFEVIVLLE